MNYTVNILLEEWRCATCHRYYCSEKYNTICAMCASDSIEELKKRVNTLERRVISYKALIKKRRTHA